MRNEHAEKWGLLSDIVTPCADISFAYDGPDRVSVTMHFSRAKGNPPRDLSLIFKGAISARWESESFGLYPLPSPLPHCIPTEWSSWVFPLLKVKNSSWLAAHEAHHPAAAERREHFVLVAMNDLMQLLALPEVEANWIEVQQ